MALRNKEEDIVLLVAQFVGVVILVGFISGCPNLSSAAPAWPTTGWVDD